MSPFPVISPPDAHVREQAEKRQMTLTKPLGALGRLEEIGCWIAACQGQCPPKAISDVAVIVFAGDHGVAASGVSAYPAEVSQQMADTIRAGGAAISVLSRRAGARVSVLDVSLNHESTDPNHVRAGAGSIDVEDAMSKDEYQQALQVGIDAADREIDSGADLLIAGDLGIGNTTPAAAIIGTVTRTEPVVVVGRGTGVDDEGWKRKTAAIRDAMFRVRNLRDEPATILQFISSPDITAMAGFLAQAAVRRTPVILDGVVVAAAALMAEALAPGAKEWWLAGHKSKEPAHMLALDYLNLTPLLDLGMRLGEGTGAALALPIVQSAVDILRDMSTFAEAGVSEKDEGAGAASAAGEPGAASGADAAGEPGAASGADAAGAAAQAGSATTVPGAADSDVAAQ